MLHTYWSRFKRALYNQLAHLLHWLSSGEFTAIHLSHNEFVIKVDTIVPRYGKYYDFIGVFTCWVKGDAEEVPFDKTFDFRVYLSKELKVVYKDEGPVFQPVIPKPHG